MGERLDLRARQGGVFFLLLNALNSRRCAHRRLLDQRGPTSNAEEEFSLRIQKRLSPSLVLCSRILTFSPLPDVPLYHFSHRKITGPTRKSAKGGWTPEEVGRRVFFFDVDVDVGIEKNRKKNFSSLLWSSRLADFAFDHHETLKRACEIAPAQGIEKSCSKVVPVWAPRSLFPLSLLSSSSTALSLSRRLPSFVEIGCRRKKKKKGSRRARLHHSLQLQLYQNFKSNHQDEILRRAVSHHGGRCWKQIGENSAPEKRARISTKSRMHFRPNKS